MLGTIMAFALGAVVGFAYARWLAKNTIPDDAPDASPVEVERPLGPLDPVDPVDLVVPAVTARAKPNKKARKAGLTEADFTPSDDILERLRLAQAGRLDPTALDSDAAPAPDTEAEAEPEAGPDDPEATPRSPERRAEATPPDPDLAEAERRVLERLRRMAGRESEGDAEG